MIGRKFVVALLLSFVLVGGIASAAYLHSTVAQYRTTAPCAKLKGIPGLLQKAHFIDTATCTVDLARGGCTNEFSACVVSTTPSGVQSLGICRNSYAGCVCAPQ